MDLAGAEIVCWIQLPHRPCSLARMPGLDLCQTKGIIARKGKRLLRLLTRLRGP